MIEIKPNIQHHSICPYDGAMLKPIEVLWPGLGIYVKTKCDTCHTEFIEALRVGHSVRRQYQIDIATGKHFYQKTNDNWFTWYTDPFGEYLQNPQPESVPITKEVFKECQRVIILNTIDNVYGHCLMKLLNAQRHLDGNPAYGLIVIVQPFKRAMVPDGVAEIWTIDIPLRNGHYYYPNFHQFVTEELKRFEQIYVSKAHSHPSQFDITRFSGVPKHNFAEKDYKITYIWREDRLWCRTLFYRILRKLQIIQLGLLLQNWKVRKLFTQLRAKFPNAKFVVAAQGKNTKFPEWIEDCRVEKYDLNTDEKMNKIYSQSRVIIGIHGSSILKPSAHAGMTISLMPQQRWHDIVTDILYQEADPRIAAFRYRYVPIEISINEIVNMATSMILKYDDFVSDMIADQKS
ncbi:MAG TPA: hypothetical protein DEG17_01495 [Cyanobacteria bacterium UBA11149]|nr:hypothetical protein [Cyanobacteria bacterium UBA11367]HBE56704.1 hypothetical protein [Cyanobacteria bacterium UBA11366]HBK63009.1 hypothetical protein [Cyanobacteria bacterium UBA11166]HBR76342.1 hypothetical protein [Cyanobacteria bacterium UBA11159]HBS70390.1 hypothetical protein [Cyanobacteria bacterium UBA11153]HBW87584.1 hypothetical protein [Cyanobacteria bacterium UBA11149]HCA97166.1 hypothetical protein [Cyanobacteria bacterium UBA9226]